MTTSQLKIVAESTTETSWYLYKTQLINWQIRSLSNWYLWNQRTKNINSALWTRVQQKIVHKLCWLNFVLKVQLRYGQRLWNHENPRVRNCNFTGHTPNFKKIPAYLPQILWNQRLVIKLYVINLHPTSLVRSLILASFHLCLRLSKLYLPFRALL